MVDELVRGGDYESWFRGDSIGLFTTTVPVIEGRAIGAEQAMFYDMFQGDPAAVQDVMAEMNRRRRAGEGSSPDVPSSSGYTSFFTHVSLSSLKPLCLSMFAPFP